MIKWPRLQTKGSILLKRGLIESVIMRKILICAQQEKKRILNRERTLFIAIYKLTSAYLSVFNRFGRDFHYRE